MKKLWIACIFCCLCADTIYAKDVYFEAFTDTKTGIPVDYFDLNEDTTRTYFTQNAWFSDNDSFIVRGESDQRLYRYDVSSHRVEALFDDSCLPLDNASVVGLDNTVYAKNNSDGNLYTQKVIPEDEREATDTLAMTLPFLDNYTSDEVHTDSEGADYTENGLTLRLNNVNRWRDVVTVAKQRGGRWCRVTVCQNRSSSGGNLWYDYYTYDYSQKSSHMSYTVDNSRISSDTRNVTIEFDYYDDSNSELTGKSIEIKYLKYNNGDTPTEGTKRIAITGTDTWKTARVDLTDAQFDKSGAVVSDGRYYDFRIGIGYNRGGFASTWIKVYPTPTIGEINNLGRVKGWHPHVSKNGDLSLTTGDAQKIIIYEADKQRTAETDVWVNSSHAIINPVYPHLVLYTDDSTDSTKTFERIRLFNRNTMFKGCIFKPYSNLSGGVTTGEAIGHESWSLDGEHIVAVKYDKPGNIGKNGIVRMDKNGENREYLNDDYNYWHCAASPDGSWIVADTIPVNNIINIVLIDAKTGKSHLVARQTGFTDDPGQPHPSFNLDGTKVTFAMAKRTLNSSGSGYVMGVGIADVSSVVNNGQLKEPASPADFRLSPFEIGFNKDLGRNEARIRVDNIDGENRDMDLYTAVYDADGVLISVRKSRYCSSEDETISAEIGDVDKGKTFKCFLWNDNEVPIKNPVDTIRLLRAARVGANEVVLSWQHETDMPVIKYEVYRGEMKIGETVDTVYRDSGLSKETQYTYYVRPIYYNAFRIGKDGECIVADTAGIDFDGTASTLRSPGENNGLTVFENGGSGSQIAGDKVGVKVTTAGETVSALLQENIITENGLRFVLNNDSSIDGYSVPKVTGGKSCRQLSSSSTSMLCFRFNKDIIPEDITSVDIAVEYYGYNYTGGTIRLYYTATDGTTKTVDVASPSTSSSSGSKQWKTATVSIKDAKFIAGLNRGSDFLIKSTNSGAQIASVTVTKKSVPTPSEHQCVEWSVDSDASSGLSRISGGAVEGDHIWVNSPNDWLKFSVDDVYMYGKSNNMAWVEITYKDLGTSKIYLYYNTSDPTASAPRADKQADTVITGTATGEWTTAVIPVIDANFSNYDGYDFRIGTDYGVSIRKVRVLGY